jgi:hypothetical protein
MLPLWASLFAVLLLSQWAGAGAACLSHLAGERALLCTVGRADRAPDPQDQAITAACPLCAPLPPALLPGPAVIAMAPAARPAVIAPVAIAWSTPVAALPSPLQPRAPPTRA